MSLHVVDAQAAAESTVRPWVMREFRKHTGSALAGVFGGAAAKPVAAQVGPDDQIRVARPNLRGGHRRVEIDFAESRYARLAAKHVGNLPHVAVAAPHVVQAKFAAAGRHLFPARQHEAREHRR